MLSPLMTDTIKSIPIYIYNDDEKEKKQQTAKGLDFFVFVSLHYFHMCKICRFREVSV